jgi:hypothetical protein
VTRFQLARGRVITDREAARRPRRNGLTPRIPARC